MFLLLLLAGSAAAAPTVIDSGGRTRTVTWNVNDPDVSLENVTIDDGTGVLSWRATGIAWTTAGDFTRNGTLDSSLDSFPGGILLNDPPNRVVSGDFASPAAWTFTRGAGGSIDAAWDSPSETGIISHVSAESPRVLWDSLDSELGWQPAQSLGGSNSELATVHSGQQEGDAMVQNDVVTGIAQDSWAGAQRIVSANWSAYDRLLVWVYAPPGVLASFNITALMGSDLRGTAPVPLVPGWQRLVLDLAPLGPGRSSISLVTWRFNGPGLMNIRFFLDDIRLSTAKLLEGAGAISQALLKPDSAAPSPGNASLSFRWRLANQTGAKSFALGVNLTLLGSGYGWETTPTETGGWNHFEADVGAIFAPPGSYDLSLWIRLAVDTVEATNVTMLFDDVALRHPGARNGTFTSNLLGFGGRAEMTHVAWNATIPGSGSVAVSVRAGNTLGPDDGTWGPWWTSSSPGTYALSRQSRYFQIRVNLAATSVFETPTWDDFTIRAIQRYSAGIVTTASFSPTDAFLRWIRLEADMQLGSAGSVSFSAGNATVWREVSPGESLDGMPARVRVRAILQTTDLVESPALERIRIIYELHPSIADWATIVGSPGFIGAVVAAGGAYVAYAILMRRFYSIEDVFIVARDGRLMLHNTRRMRAEWDEDMFAGMLTAIAAFVKDSFKDDAGYLKRFEFAGKTVLIERIDSMYIAAIYEGRVPRWAQKNLQSFVSDLENRFGDRLASWSGSPEDLQGLKDLADRFVGRLRYRAASRRSAS